MQHCGLGVCSTQCCTHYLTADARGAAHAGMPGLGKVGAPGSASFVVSQGKADNSGVSTEGIVLIAAGAALAAAVVVVIAVAVTVRRRKRSTPAVIELDDIHCDQIVVSV